MRDKYSAYKLLETAVDIAFPEFDIAAADDSTVLLKNIYTGNMWQTRWRANGSMVIFSRPREWDYDGDEDLKHIAESIVWSLEEGNDDVVEALLSSYLNVCARRSRFIDYHIPDVIVEQADTPFMRLLRKGALHIDIAENINESDELKPSDRRLLAERSKALTIGESKIARELIVSFYRYYNDHAPGEFVKCFHESLEYLTEKEFVGIIEDVLRYEKINGRPEEFLDAIVEDVEFLPDDMHKRFTLLESKFGATVYTEEDIENVLRFVDNIETILKHDQRIRSDLVSREFIDNLKVLVDEFRNTVSSLGRNAILYKIIQELARVFPGIGAASK